MQTDRDCDSNDNVQTASTQADGDSSQMDDSDLPLMLLQSLKSFCQRRMCQFTLVLIKTGTRVPRVPEKVTLIRFWLGGGGQDGSKLIRRYLIPGGS